MKENRFGKPVNASVRLSSRSLIKPLRKRLTNNETNRKADPWVKKLITHIYECEYTRPDMICANTQMHVAKTVNASVARRPKCHAA